MKLLSLKKRFQDIHFLFTFRVQYFNYVTSNDINVTTFVMSYNKMPFDVVSHDSNSPSWSLIKISVPYTILILSVLAEIVSYKHVFYVLCNQCSIFGPTACSDLSSHDYSRKSSHIRGQSSIGDQFMWNSWWAKCRRYKVFFEHFSVFPFTIIAPMLQRY